MSASLPASCTHTRRDGLRLARAIAGAVLTALVLLTASCGSDDKPKKDEPRLLVIDGIEITFEELQPYVDFLQSYRPELGKKTTYIWAMREHMLPMKVARLRFPEERKKQLALAQGFRSVATNIYEMEKQAKLIQHKTRSNLTRQSAMLPVATWLFEQEIVDGERIPVNVNAASPPIELPQGYFVVGSFEFFDSPLVMADYVDAMQVGFVTHTGKEWQKWWAEEQQRIGSKVTFVHPDYRDDLPEWMEVPKTKKKP